MSSKTAPRRSVRKSAAEVRERLAKRRDALFSVWMDALATERDVHSDWVSAKRKLANAAAAHKKADEAWRATDVKGDGMPSANPPVKDQKVDALSNRERSDRARAERHVEDVRADDARRRFCSCVAAYCSCAKTDSTSAPAPLASEKPPGYDCLF
jgi:hypothetical protein